MEASQQGAEMTEDEKAGVAAIQYLLSLNGQSESEAVSRANWRNFDRWERENTMAAYSVFQRLKAKRAGFPTVEKV